MQNKKLYFLLALICFTSAQADIVKTFQGLAKKDAKIFYIEKHTLTYADTGILKAAKTEYFAPDNRPLATLTSEFSVSLSVPNYEMNYLTNGNKEGVRRSEKDIVLFDQAVNKEEKNLIIKESEQKDKIIMAGQGFNYYLIENLNQVKEMKIFPIRLLIPGKLDFYDFRVKFLSENKDGDMDFELSVDNWALRLVAPSFLVRYNKNSKRIIYYKGLSNIPDDKNKNHVVEINYSH